VDLVVKAREIHPLQLDADLSAENWPARFTKQAGLPASEAIARAVELVETLELADAEAKHWRGPDAHRFGLEMADILSTMPIDEDALLAALLYRSVRIGRLALRDVRDQFGKTPANLIKATRTSSMTATSIRRTASA